MSTVLNCKMTNAATVDICIRSIEAQETRSNILTLLHYGGSNILCRKIQRLFFLSSFRH